MIEIERKFLVNSSLFKEQSHKKTKIIQGYLSKDPERTVRIRIRENKGFITIKGVSSGNGLSRYEWEKEIPVQEANELILLCLPKVINSLLSVFSTVLSSDKRRLSYTCSDIISHKSGCILNVFGKKIPMSSRIVDFSPKRY